MLGKLRILSGQVTVGGSSCVGHRRAMFELITVGYDGRDGGDDALALASEIAAACSGRLLVAQVRREGFPLADPIALPEGSEVITLPERTPAEALAELADQRGADLIVVGSSHRGEPGLTFLGSTAEELVHHATAAVAVSPRGLHRSPDLRIRVIGVGVDGSPAAQRALNAGGELAKAARATMRIFHVHEGASALAEDPSGSWESLVPEATAHVPPATRPAGTVLDGPPDIALKEEAEKGVDLLMLGSSARGRFGRAALGGVSVSLIRSTPCPVVVFPKRP